MHGLLFDWRGLLASRHFLVPLPCALSLRWWQCPLACHHPVLPSLPPSPMVANGAPRLSLFHCSVLGPHRGGHPGYTSCQQDTLQGVCVTKAVGVCRLVLPGVRTYSPGISSVRGKGGWVNCPSTGLEVPAFLENMGASARSQPPTPPPPPAHAQPRGMNAMRLRTQEESRAMQRNGNNNSSRQPAQDKSIAEKLY